MTRQEENSWKIENRAKNEIASFWFLKKYKKELEDEMMIFYNFYVYLRSLRLLS